ncbi:MAG: O-antigen ligase family protein [candidate division Zixibacteria bacterium]|nr:O-antigen ligase family protein [candidate division Zixibacteria bacterium]
MNAAVRLSDRAIFFVYTIFIFSSTFSVAAGSLAGGAASLLFLTLAIQRRYLPFESGLKWFYVWACLYLFWSILSSQLAHPGWAALAPLGREWLFFLVPTGMWVFQNAGARRVALYAFAAGIILISLYSVGQFFWAWNFLKPHYIIERHLNGYYLIGNFGSSVAFGIYYATAGLFFFGYGLKSSDQRMEWSHRLFLVTGLLAMGVAVLSNERGPTLAVVTGLIVLAILLSSKKVLVGVGLALLVVLAVGFQSGVFVRSKELMSKELSMRHDRSRLFIWTYSLRVAEEHPLLGVGPGHMKEGYTEVVPTDIPDITLQGHAHNDLLTVAAERGFPGAIFLLALWAAVLGYCFRAQRSAMLTPDERGLALGALVGSLGFMVTSMFDVPFAGSTTRQMLMFVWAAGLAMYVKSKSVPAPGTK